VDNLTHSLVGALLGRTGLKRLTPYAMPALIISANLPDIDSFFARPLGYEAIEAHRGFSHGLGGLIVMPILASAIMLLWQKFRSSKDGPIRPAGLLFVCFLGVLSHPLLDFLNTYGTRLFEPFSHRWFYGDTLFIMDPWIWLMLILGLEMSWRAERLGLNWTRPAIWTYGAVLGYIPVNAALSARAVAAARPLVERIVKPDMIVAGEGPLQFWKRRMIWRGGGLGGAGSYDPLSDLGRAWLDPDIVPLNLDDPRLAAALKRDPRARGFYFWSRMPIVVVEDGRAYLGDQRFTSGRVRRGFLVPLDSEPSAP
jgi:inner membrane protein